MSAPKFTPGPWRMHDMEAGVIVAGRPGGEVANVNNGFGDRDANAALIAAAPDLYEALKSAVSWLVQVMPDAPLTPRGEELLASYRAALSKAEGQQ